ncbi:hypothetical protein O6H91_20G009000 [Diphasiastrum complanatum]|uniref:Uncharacterized protein n=1 Tax=Diphasiastrum complanatum TaxID=34168 RepID=A0ACC2AMR0_DIPCM|nr:hypothetical protein O6H91_20G009000 [Diphasiastrum complanatum]
MAFLKLALCFLLFALLLSSYVSAQCNPNNFGSLTGCLSAAGNRPMKPSQNCCNALKAYQGKAQCLCATLTAAKQKVSSINIANALRIPRTCGYGNYIPRGFKCNGQTIP